MKPRFTLRDLFWLTLVVAMGVAWWLDRDRLATQLESFTQIPRSLQPLDLRVGPIPNP